MKAEDLEALFFGIIEAGVHICPICGGELFVSPAIFCLSEHLKSPIFAIDCLHCGWFIAMTEKTIVKRGVLDGVSSVEVSNRSTLKPQ